MRSYFPILLIFLLIVSGFGAISTNIEKSFNSPLIFNVTLKEKINIDISSLKIENSDKYIEVSFKDIAQYLMNPGQPMIPKIHKKYELPFGTTNIKVEAEPKDVQEIKILKKIKPSPSPLPLTPRSNAILSAGKDASIYNSNELYPHDWVGYHAGCGLNAEGKRITHLNVNTFPLRYNPVENKVIVAKEIKLKITYDNPNINFLPEIATYDLLIITPLKFKLILQKFVKHKEKFGIKTILKTTNEIYKEYDGYDKPEQIKLCIKDMIETYGITYVLLFGGLKSKLYAKPKDDVNHGATGWYVPVRYSNFQWDGGLSYNYTSGEPGYISDLYYADIYKEGGEFEDWNSNENGVYAEWAGDLRDELDLYPDVCIGRLPCRNSKEAIEVINKIINYEKQPADPSWFKKMASISGDGCLDQEDWNIQWDTKGLADGEYVICAQSRNPDGVLGPVDEIHISLDKTAETNITFNHDDHLKKEVQEGYPAPPIAEIMTISNGNTLGNTDFEYTPTNKEAYCNDHYWYVNISYIDEVLAIRGKSYDPKPYGNVTSLKVWINNSIGETIFTQYRYDLETYYEGEWMTGEKIFRGRGGAIAYMPDDFEFNSIFTSNGKWTGQLDIIKEFSKGYGFVYFNGHGSPVWCGDQYPGFPGNREHSLVSGLSVTQISFSFPFFRFPLFPMNKLTNKNKLPVVCIGGCHNSMFSISLIPSIMSMFIENYMFTYGTPISECWSWHMVKLPKTGAIAVMGDTGFGWGSEGKVCTIGGGDGWINTEFFRQYGQENQKKLGMAYSQAIASYIDYHKTLEFIYWRHDYGWDGIDEKTVQQWELLGDPSLLIGGYP